METQKKNHTVESKSYPAEYFKEALAEEISRIKESKQAFIRTIFLNQQVNIERGSPVTLEDVIKGAWATCFNSFSSQSGNPYRTVFLRGGYEDIDISSLLPDSSHLRRNIDLREVGEVQGIGDELQIEAIMEVLTANTPAQAVSHLQLLPSPEQSQTPHIDYAELQGISEEIVRIINPICEKMIHFYRQIFEYSKREQDTIRPKQIMEIPDELNQEKTERLESLTRFLDRLRTDKGSGLQSMGELSDHGSPDPSSDEVLKLGTATDFSIVSLVEIFQRILKEEQPDSLRQEEVQSDPRYLAAYDALLDQFKIYTESMEEKLASGDIKTGRRLESISLEEIDFKSTIETLYLTFCAVNRENFGVESAQITEELDVEEGNVGLEVKVSERTNGFKKQLLKAVLLAGVLKRRRRE
jgi:hypothetical protein